METKHDYALRERAFASGRDKRTLLPFTKGWLFATLRLALAAAAGAVSLTCAWGQVVTAQDAIPTKPEVKQRESPGVQVIVVNPLVQFEDVRSYRTVPKIFSQEDVFASRILVAARREVEARKLGVVNPELAADMLIADDWTQLQGLSPRLARGNVTEEARGILKRLADGDDRHLVLVQYMRVKVGPSGSWNPSTGAIASSISSTLLQAALVAPNSGQVIWKNEVFVRKVFDPDSPEFTKNLALLYQTFAAK